MTELKGVKCQECHFNLYALDSNGNEKDKK